MMNETARLNSRFDLVSNQRLTRRFGATADWVAGARIALRVVGAYCLGCLLIAAVTPARATSGQVWFAALTPHLAAAHHCLFCGMTRAFVCLAHGRLERAEALNRLSLLVFLAFVLAAGAGVVDAIHYAASTRRAKTSPGERNAEP